jgi:ammonia channel protein AmtB
MPGMIHLAGGSMALMGTIVIGSRTDRFALGSRTEEVEYGNKTLQYLGLLMGAWKIACV